jgi:RimJ/RimL family protein N-acetyltransferase
MYVIENNKEPVGQVRFEAQNDKLVIGYSVGSEQRGKGYGFALLQAAIGAVTKDINSPFCLWAQVKGQNLPSLKIFQKLGFIEIDHISKKDGVHTFELQVT